MPYSRKQEKFLHANDIEHKHHNKKLNMTKKEYDELVQKNTEKYLAKYNHHIPVY